jgi:integrase
MRAVRCGCATCPQRAAADDADLGQTRLALPASSADDRLGPLFETLIGTGMRRGEVLALRWEDVDPEARSLHVRRTLSTVNGRLVRGDSKPIAGRCGWRMDAAAQVSAG